MNKADITDKALFTNRMPETRQAPSFRVHHAGCATHEIPLLGRVSLWLAAYRPRMQLEGRGTEDQLDGVA
uniref:AraC family transcriptional regulator n=1 Tax=Mesocestoides corti TaxID=53468 RepID=A0A5K3G1F9_MESCO